MKRCRWCIAWIISAIIHLLVIFVVMYTKKNDLDTSSQAPTAMKLSQFVQQPPTPPTPLAKPTPPKALKQQQKPLPQTPLAPKSVEKKVVSRDVNISTPPPLVSPQVPRKASRFLEALNDNFEPPSKIKELYGQEFEHLKPEQKKFIKDNLEGIGKVTQEYLYKTPLSIIKSMDGVAIVEFNLEPNGDITNLKVRQSSTFTILDRHAIRTIENAHKEYPKPTVSTPIRIYVNYKIER